MRSIKEYNRKGKGPVETMSFKDLFVNFTSKPISWIPSGIRLMEMNQMSAHKMGFDQKYPYLS